MAQKNNKYGYVKNLNILNVVNDSNNSRRRLNTGFPTLS